MITARIRYFTDDRRGGPGHSAGPTPTLDQPLGGGTNSFLVDGTQSHRVWLMVMADVPNWFWSQTRGLIGVFVTPKHSRCKTGLTILEIWCPTTFVVGRHNSTGTDATWTFTAWVTNSSRSRMPGGGL